MKFHCIHWICALILAQYVGLAQQGGQGADEARPLTGIIKFNGLPLPGATVIASRSDSSVSAITNRDGIYVFNEMLPGAWKITVQMSGFSPLEREITIPTGAAARLEWELKMLPLESINAQAQAPASAPAPVAASALPQSTKKPTGKPTTTQTPFQRTDLNASGPAPQANAPAQPGSAASGADPAELSQRAADGFLINGTANNGAASPFGQSAAFGNFRKGAGSLYNANLGVILGDSVLDARPYSLNGQSIPKPDYSRIQAMLSFGGPLRIPHILKRNGPNLTLNYQWSRNSNVTTQSGLVPTSAERNGDLGRFPNAIFDPASVAESSTYFAPVFLIAATSWFTL